MKNIISLFLSVTLFLSLTVSSFAQTNAITLLDGERVYGAEFSIDGTKVIVGTRNNVELHESVTGQIIRKMAQQPIFPEGMQFSFGAFAFSADGKKLLGGHLLGIAVLWELETGEVIHYFIPPNSAPSGTPAWSTSTVAFSADGKEMATLKGGALTFWDVETGTMLREGKGTFINGLDNSFGEMFLYPDGARVFTRLLSHSFITNYITGERVADFGSRNAVLSNDGSTVFMIDSPNQSYKIIDVASKNVLRTFSPNVIGSRLSVAPDNQTVAYSYNNIIYIERWPLVGDRKELAQIPFTTIYEFEFPFLRFSPDGKQLMVRQNKSLRLYDISNLTSGVKEAELLKR